jgi:Ca2+-binding EF-hand superfamily protein
LYRYMTAMLHSEDFVSQTIAAFKWADADGSGTLDVYEFCPAARQCILRWLSEDVDDAKLHEAFRAFDDNGDRKLSATEFVQFLQYCAVRTVKQSCG